MSQINRKQRSHEMKRRSAIQHLGIWCALLLLVGTAQAQSTSLHYASLKIMMGGVTDYDYATDLKIGEFLQLIDVGPNGQVDEPDRISRNPGGDDSLLEDSSIGSGGTWPGEYSDTHTVPLYTVVYVRAWNDTVLMSATHYGHSELYEVRDFNPSWYALKWSTTKEAPIEVKINFQPSNSPTPPGYLKGDATLYGSRYGHRYGWR